MTDRPLYPKLDPRDLEPYYSRHKNPVLNLDRTDAAIQLAWRDKQIADLTAERDKLATRIRGLEAGCEHRFDSDGDCMYCEMKDPRR